ncbi:plasmid partition protein ParG [Enterocloster aldenensis]
MKRITVVLDDDIHKAAKVKAVLQDTSIIKYIADLVEKDLKENVKKEQTH